MRYSASGVAIPVIAFMAALTVHGALLWAWALERPVVAPSPTPVLGVTLVALPTPPGGGAPAKSQPLPAAGAPASTSAPARPADNGLDRPSTPRQSRRPATEPPRRATPGAATPPAKPPRRTSHPVIAKPASVGERSEDRPRVDQVVTGHTVSPAALPQASSAAGAAAAVSSTSELRAEVFERLRQAVARHKRYPLKSRRRGEQGRVTVRLTLNPGGAISAVTLAASSGHRRLDNAALRAVRQASPLAGLDGRLTRPVQLSLPVVFRFK